MTDSDERRVAKALQGLEFPAEKKRIIEYAEARGADAKTLRALAALEGKQYGDSSEVLSAVPQRPEQASGGGAQLG